jgi:hypothetical protein
MKLFYTIILILCAQAAVSQTTISKTDSSTDPTVHVSATAIPAGSAPVSTTAKGTVITGTEKAAVEVVKEITLTAVPYHAGIVPAAKSELTVTGGKAQTATEAKPAEKTLNATKGK